MKQRKSSLFVVVDPTTPHQLALVKALLIAKLGSCHIHAFMCVYEDVEKGAASSRKDFKRKVLAQAAERLEDMMQACRMSDVSYSTEIVWNQEWVHSLARAVAKSSCDLLIKSSYHHSKARRFFSKTADYYLMHHCACPILFTHQGQEWKSDRMLACLDLESTDLQHTRLNSAIMRDAKGFAAILGMDLYIAGAWQAALNRDHLGLETRHAEIGPKQVGEVYGIAEDRVLLRRGPVVKTLRSICAEVDPCIVVVGTLAQRGISEKLIGSTAHKLIDNIEADLLTVY